ncbi:hypothetical protein BH11PSE12_BH11PSE12_33240 [soil metagenome]
MGKSISTNIVQRESEWRNYLARFAGSGQTITAFCRSESLSEGSFYFWRKRLQTHASSSTTAPSTATAPFIDLGLVDDTKARRVTAQIAETTPSQNVPVAGITMRIDLGGGIVLTIARH